MDKHCIVGCGDVGRRLAQYLLSLGISAKSISAFARSSESLDKLRELVGLAGESELRAYQLDFDGEFATENLKELDNAFVYYLVPTNKQGKQDLRSCALLKQLSDLGIKAKKIILISTTGVYGDCKGGWVSEEARPKPNTERAYRRLDAEQQWQQWAQQMEIDCLVLRVPGIYANSRLPRQRIQQRLPVVRAEECGYSNRIHADDLAMICYAAAKKGLPGNVYNISDGNPAKMSDYFQAIAAMLGEAPLPEISLSEAPQYLSAGMLSYLSESRKISNQKMLQQLQVILCYPDYLQGIKFG